MSGTAPPRRRWRQAGRRSRARRARRALSALGHDGAVVLLSGKLQRLTTPRIAIKGEATLADRTLSGKLGLSTPALRPGRQRRGRSRGEQLRRAQARPAPAPAERAIPQYDRARRAAPCRSRRPLRDRRLPLRLVESAHRVLTRPASISSARPGRASFRPHPSRCRSGCAPRRSRASARSRGGILANLDVAGTLRIDAKALVGNDLRLSSDKLKGKLLLRIDLVTGRYDVALTGGLTRLSHPWPGHRRRQHEGHGAARPHGLGTVISGTGQAIVPALRQCLPEIARRRQSAHRHAPHPHDRRRDPFLEPRPHRPRHPHRRQRHPPPRRQLPVPPVPARRPPTARSA